MNITDGIIGKTVWTVEKQEEYEYKTSNNSVCKLVKGFTLHTKKLWISKQNIWKLQELWKQGLLFFSLQDVENYINKMDRTKGEGNY